MVGNKWGVDINNHKTTFSICLKGVLVGHMWKWQVGAVAEALAWLSPYFWSCHGQLMEQVGYASKTDLLPA